MAGSSSQLTGIDHSSAKLTELNYSLVINNFWKTNYRICFVLSKDIGKKYKNALKLNFKLVANYKISTIKYCLQEEVELKLKIFVGFLYI